MHQLSASINEYIVIWWILGWIVAIIDKVRGSDGVVESECSDIVGDFILLYVVCLTLVTNNFHLLPT